MKYFLIFFFNVSLFFHAYSHEDISTRQMGALAEVEKNKSQLKLSFIYHIDDLETILKRDLKPHHHTSEMEVISPDFFQNRISFTCDTDLSPVFSQLKAISPFFYRMQVKVPLLQKSDTVKMVYYFPENHSGSDRLSLSWRNKGESDVLYLHGAYKTVSFNLNCFNMKSEKTFFSESRPQPLTFSILILLAVVIIFFNQQGIFLRSRNVKNIIS